MTGQHERKDVETEAKIREALNMKHAFFRVGIALAFFAAIPALIFYNILQGRVAR